MKSVKIETEYIRLDQFLKWSREAETGAQAKNMIKNGKVKVNGESELRRGRKLRPGDKVEVEGRAYLVEG